MNDRRRLARRAWPLPDQLEDRWLPSGYTPAQITSAYDLNSITFRSPTGSIIQGDGAGRTIALIEEYNDPNIRSDLKAFDRTYGLPDPSLTVLDQAGDQTSNSWAIEESMDVEYAHAIAPAASILVVEAAPANSQTKELQNQLAAVDTARHTKGVVAVSMSWGFNEMPDEASYDTHFTTPAGHPGITFIASSGDLGFTEYPAASPNVLSVGGTSLSLTSSGSYQSETAWFFGGGGYSPYEPEPAYQMAVQTTGQRAMPDVAFDTDPSTGVEVYETPPGSREGSWQVCGGTSLGAPAWAGIIAIVDQGRALEGKGSLDGPTQTLPALYALASSDFHGAIPLLPVGTTLVLAMVALRVRLRRRHREHRDGPGLARRPIADLGPGGERDDERKWPAWKLARQCDPAHRRPPEASPQDSPAPRARPSGGACLEHGGTPVRRTRLAQREVGSVSSGPVQILAGRGALTGELLGYLPLQVLEIQVEDTGLLDQFQEPLGGRALVQSRGRGAAAKPLRCFPEHDRQIFQDARDGSQLGDHELQSPLGAVMSEQHGRQLVVRGSECVVVGHVAALGIGIAIGSGDDDNRIAIISPFVAGVGRQEPPLASQLGSAGEMRTARPSASGRFPSRWVSPLPHPASVRPTRTDLRHVPTASSLAFGGGCASFMPPERQCPPRQFVFGTAVALTASQED